MIRHVVLVSTPIRRCFQNTHCWGGTWLGLSETGKADGRTKGPAIPTVLEPGWKTEAHGGTGRNGTVRMRVSERRAHVARSLRDRESGWNDKQSLLFRQSSNRNGKPWRTVELGGMERPECESRRDSPTWLGLSETGNAGGRTSSLCYSDSLRTGMGNRGERWNLEEWNSQNASLGETRPRGTLSPPYPGPIIELPKTIASAGKGKNHGPRPASSICSTE